MSNILNYNVSLHMDCLNQEHIDLVKAIENRDFAHIHEHWQFYQQNQNSTYLPYILEIAVEHGDLDIVKHVWQYFKPTTKDINRAVYIAADNGYLDKLSFLCDCKCNVNDVLWLASRNGHLDTVKFLCQFTNTNKIYSKSLKHAVYNKYFEVAKYIYDYAHVENDMVIKLWKKAMLSGDLDVVKFLYDFMIKNNNELTVYDGIFVAATEGHLPIVEFLTEENVSHLSRSNPNKNVLFKKLCFDAVKQGNLNILKYTLKKCNLIFFNLTDLFLKAIIAGHLHIIEYLLKISGFIDTQYASDLLILAIKYQQVDIVKYFLRNNVDIYDCDDCRFSNTDEGFVIKYKGEPIEITYEIQMELHSFSQKTIATKSAANNR